MTTIADERDHRVKRLFVLLVMLTGFVFGAATPAIADVNDFRFASFDADYFLGTDADGHSVLRTVETLVAVFPEFDQNRGIRRDLVDRYDGHPTDLRIDSITDENGTPRAWEAESDDDFLQVTIATDAYVHGEQTYVISYTQRFVTKYFSDTDADEFYWDTNGTGWAQPFGSVTARVHLADGLAERLTGDVTAVHGFAGEANPAETVQTDDGFEFRAGSLGPGQNLTFAIGFEPGTFTPRDGGFFAAPWPSISVGAALLALLAAFGAVVVRRTTLADAPGRGIIIAEYQPPKDANLFLSTLVLNRTAKVVPAAILKLAVAGNLRVVEEKHFGKPRYAIELLTENGADADEVEFLAALFGDLRQPGTRKRLKGTDSRAVKRIAEIQKQVKLRAYADGYRKKVSRGSTGLLVLVAAITGTAAVAFAAVSLDQAFGGAWPVLPLVVGIASAIAVMVLVSRAPLAEPGVALRDHLKGLKEYIHLAEGDRIRYLQSPQGALRTPIDTTDTAQLVELGEKLLPYAVIFGEEKKWAEELGRYYEETGSQPSWYSGTTAFSAGVFASSIGSVSTSASSSFSSSGGSGGGASSGGGGGGGGGGGV